MKKFTGIMILASVGLLACGKPPRHSSAVTSSGSTPSAGDDAITQDEEKPAEEPAKTMLTCSTSDGRAYKGFGGISLAAGRIIEVPKEGDRFRVKPYLTLAGEFTRVMGAVPASLAANASTFAAAPDRWYIEPQASAITLFTSFRVSYEAALTAAAADPKYAAAPTEQTATANCTTFARQAWNRIPSTEEIAACTRVALIDTAAETDIKARWAYTLASVLTATGFIAY